MTIQKREVDQGALLRWAGSKRKLLSVLEANAPDSFGTYVEPFVGSGCFFFRLQPERSILGDINHRLIGAYRHIRQQPAALHRGLCSLPQSKYFYYALRDVPAELLTPSEQVAQFVYLNRYSFNGVYRTNKSGDFNVPRGVRTGGIPHVGTFTACSRALKKAALVNADFELVVELARPGDFLYLDPPYRPQGVRHRGEYGYDSFSGDDFDRLRDAMRRASKRGVHVLLSFFDCNEVRDAFHDWHIAYAKTKRHVAGFASRRISVTEVLIRNY